MITDRSIAAAVRKAAGEYPVITILGPRQSGKTTLCKMLFADKPYFSLENPTTRLYASDDPEGFLQTIPDGAILDEVQRVPALLSYIQQIVDERNKKGMFVLTGSSNFSLMESVTQSLAGRTAVFKLLPFSLKESSFSATISSNSVLLDGGYPRLLTEKPDRTFFFQNYIETYIERDVRSLLKVKDTLLFQRFLRLCPGRVGSLIDYTALSNDAGISVKTVREWLSVLNASYICFLLPPWYENRGKRLVKAPKLYFYDTGLAAALAGITTEQQMDRDPLRGPLFENLVILEVLKSRLNTGLRPDLYFYRDSNGNEVDLVEQREGKLYPTEIKSAATFHTDFIKGISVFSKEYKDSSTSGFVVYGGSERIQFKGVSVIPFSYISEIFS